MEEEVVKSNEEIVSSKEGTKKSSSGCMKGLGIFVLVLVFLFLLLAGGAYWGYTKVLKANEPVDLGVDYTEQDYTNFMDEIGLDADGSVLCIDCPTPVFSNPQVREVTVSNAEASAVFEYVNQHLSNASISGTQIKMGDGEAELSTLFTFQGKTFPIYMVGSISKVSENSIDGQISTLKAGALSVPESITTYVTDFLVGTANEKLSSAGESVRIDSVDIKPEGLNFKGLVPTKAQ